MTDALSRTREYYTISAGRQTSQQASFFCFRLNVIADSLVLLSANPVFLLYLTFSKSCSAITDRTTISKELFYGSYCRWRFDWYHRTIKQQTSLRWWTLLI